MEPKEQLAARVKASSQKIALDKQAIMQASTDALIAGSYANKALKTGDVSVDFTLPNIEGSPITLSHVLANNLTVITFYRGGWCPYCNLELRAFQAALPEFDKRGAKLIAISPEIPEVAAETNTKNKLSFEVLSDVDNQVAKAFGLVFKMPVDLQELYYDSFKIDVEKHNGNSDFELPLPATYIIDKTGKIVYHFIDERYVVRAEPADILTAIDRLGN